MCILFDTRNAPYGFYILVNIKKGMICFSHFFNPEFFLDFGLLENNEHISLNNDLYFKFMSVTQTSLSQEWKDTIIVYKNSIASLPVKVEPQ